MVREEGPFPVQGHVGSIVQNEAFNMKFCGKIDHTNEKLPKINSSPNCSGSFTPDVFTTEDTCGTSCD